MAAMSRGSVADSKGFTVIESLVVILVIILLASIVIAGWLKRGNTEPDVPVGRPVPSGQPVAPKEEPKESPDNSADRKPPEAGDSAMAAGRPESIG